MLVIGLPACRWLFGMALVYPVGAPVTISKKSPLIRILSKGRDCIDFEKNVKTRLCRGRRPRRPAEGSTLGGAQRAPPVRFANTLVRLFAPQGQTLFAPRFRSTQPWSYAHNPAMPGPYNSVGQLQRVHPPAILRRHQAHRRYSGGIGHNRLLPRPAREVLALTSQHDLIKRKASVRL